MEQADPLAALEAEYAVVLAQTRTIAASACSSQPTSDAESAGSESDDEEGAAVRGFESYALLPSSPCNSDDEMTADNEDAVNHEKDAEERPQSETKKQEASTQQKDVGGLEEDKRRTIMQSMQQVKLRSPPWAAAANLTDDELVALVQKQLGLKDKST